MAEAPEALEQRLEAAIAPGARHQLLARGLARGMIWRDGELPSGAPDFSRGLSSDLLDHGYGILSRALRLREIAPASDVLDAAFRVAAEAIESTARRGDPEDRSRGFQLLVAAIASHLGGYAARAYSLLGQRVETLNLSSDERLVALIARRSLQQLRNECLGWLDDPERNPEDLIRRVASQDDFGVDDAIVIALQRGVHRAVGLLDSALVTGNPKRVDAATTLLQTGRAVAADAGHVPAWWLHVLLQHLIDDLWSHSLWVRVADEQADSEEWARLRQSFIHVLTRRDTAEVGLWPSQLEAAERAGDPHDDLVVALPTSAGKTRIAELCILRALADGGRVVYLTPLRALSAQQERTLSRTFRPLGARVSSLYGASGVARADIASFESAQIVVATPEKLDFALRHQPSILDDVGLIVLDEGHMIGIGEREVRYEALVQRLLTRADADSRRIVCLSAIFGGGELTADFTRWIRSDSPGTAIESQWRPTRHRPAELFWDGSRGRLELFVDGERPFVPGFVRSRPAIPPRRNAFPHDHAELVIATADRLMADDANVLVYCTQRNYVESLATKVVDLMRRGLIEPYPIAADISRARRIGEEWLGRAHVAVAALDLGVAVHHGALPRPFLSELEALLGDRTLRFAVASPTVAQGLDLSASALVFHSLHRAGQPIDDEEYKNVIGRVGRAFVDLDGISVLPVDMRESSWQRKLSLYRSYISGREHRTIESGIVLLIERLIESVATAHDFTRNEAIEYLLGQQTNWSERPGETTDAFEELVANLDAAILSTVEDLATPREGLADVIDRTLRNSLWRRTLERRSREDQEYQRRLLIGRAHWIWDRTTTEARRGFFASGVGFSAGSAIDAQRETLSSLVSAADFDLETGKPSGAAESLVQVEALLEDVRPFRSKSKPDDWPALLRAWISGESVADSRANASEFIQDGLVYRLVWAVEAIRAYAEIVGGTEIVSSTGRASMALTYGVPSVGGAAILRHGLPSRRLALEIAERYPPPDDSEGDLGEWVDYLVETVDATAFADPLDELLWSDFAAPTATRARRWGRRQTEIDVIWDGEVPTTGTEVRIVPESEASRVCGPDLTPIGTLGLRLDDVIRAVVGDRGRVQIERFGPSI